MVTGSEHGFYLRVAPGSGGWFQAISRAGKYSKKVGTKHGLLPSYLVIRRFLGAVNRPRR